MKIQIIHVLNKLHTGIEYYKENEWTFQQNEIRRK